MKPSWEALVARARGLSTHLLPDDRLELVEHAKHMPELIDALRGTAYEEFLGAGDETPAALELGVTLALQRQMALLAKWAGPDGSALGALFIEQDARNMRNILRGVVGALTPAERTASAIPTPFLPWKRLAALARLESPGEIAARLVAWGHPLGPALSEATLSTRPDLFRLETVLARGAANAAAGAARKAGKTMRAFVRESIDARNAVTALLLVGARVEGDPAGFFVEGGERLSIDSLVGAASAPERASAAEALEAASRGTPLATALGEAPVGSSALSARILNARIAAYTRRSRREPLSAGPVLLFVLRLRREARAVRRALWAAALAGGRVP